MRRKKLGILNNITIEKGVAEGKCMTRHEDKVIFIEGGAPGDVVDIQLTKNKKSFMEGRVINLIEPSPIRQEPFCSYFGTCGGCKWQHIQYQEQLQLKAQQVEDSLVRIGKVDIQQSNEIIAAPQTDYYRNKLEFTFSNNRWVTKEEIDSGAPLDRDALGFHIPKRFDKILDVEHCHLQGNISNEIRNGLRGFAKNNSLTFYDIKGHVGLLRNVVIRTSSLNEVMVIVQFGEDLPDQIKQVMDYLQKTFEGITSLNYIVNLKMNDSYADQEVIHYNGATFIQEKMEELTFRVGPKSFFQTNSEQAVVLYQKAKELANIQPSDVVYDLYTGTGTIANFVARDAKKVIGIEYVEEAIQDAHVNSEINGINNTSFFAGDMKDVLNADFIRTHGQPNVIITDPPRAGMHQDVVDVLLKAAPERIVYVSCNPATQARDLQLLSEQYSVKISQPVDMFPHTHHVENITLLIKK